MANPKPKTARYVSKYRSLTIAIKSAFFKTSEDGKRELVPGNRVEFREGFFETADENLVEILESRPDFGTAFVRVPENKTTDEIKEKMRSLDEREREQNDREADLKRREKLLADQEAGRGGNSGKTDEDEDTRPAVKEAMKRADLEAIAREEGITDEDIENAELKSDLVAVIERHRLDNPADKGGDNADFGA